MLTEVPTEVSNSAGGNTTNGSGSSTASKPTFKRIEVENLAKELKKKLGNNNWDKYQATISLFLCGRLSRKEFTSNLNELLVDSKLVKFHNQLLLANLANSLRDGPLNSVSSNSGFGKFGFNKKKSNKSKISNQYEKLKKDIMSLPIKERRRIKLITRESGKRTMANSALTLTRQTLLPKIPYVSDKEKVVTGNTVEWTQDISHSLQALLCVESYHLPDAENLKIRMLGIAREHGLTGVIEKDSIDVLYKGLEYYIQNIVETAIDSVRYRKNKYVDNPFEDPTVKKDVSNKKITLTTEDMLDTLTISPYVTDPNGAIYRLYSCKLQDDSYIEEKTSIDSILKDISEINKEIEQMSEDDKKKNIGTKDELNMVIHDILSN